MKIECVGGGISGLLLGIAMTRLNSDCSVTISERNARGTIDGWGVVFWDDLFDEIATVDEELAQSIRRNARRWTRQTVSFKAERLVDDSAAGYSISRHALLETLTKRALDLGVAINFETPINSLDDLPQADVLVLSDGVNSKLRDGNGAFGSAIDRGRNKYTWLGTSKIFSDFAFHFVKTASGWIWVHAYAFDDSTSTFIVECSPETWAASGFQHLDSDKALRKLENIFAGCLDGHALQVNRNDAGEDLRWINFQRLTNSHWRSGNAVLVGDAAHTTHFSIGSGTTFAIHDVISLAHKLSRLGNVDDALMAYEYDRVTTLDRYQTEARLSEKWFEEIERYTSLRPNRFATLLRERRSVALPRIDPRLYYCLHRITNSPVLSGVRAQMGMRLRTSKQAKRVADGSRTPVAHSSAVPISRSN